MIRTYSFWIRALGALCLGAIGVSFLWRGFSTAYQNDRRTLCQENLWQLSRALEGYRQDYNDHLPPMGRKNAGWTVAVLVYAGEGDWFECPSTANPGAPYALSDYWFNARLGGSAQESLRFPARTLVMGDGEDAAPQNAALSQLPPRWLTNSASPLWRHRNGANYMFADGHVKWVRATNAASWSRQAGAPTFTMR